MYNYYGWSPYWNTGFFMGGYGYAGMGTPPLGLSPSPGEPREGATEAPDGDRHLRSVVEVTGYHLHARDGEIGHVIDALVEDGDWSLHYLVADTQNWWPGKKVLISPRSVASVSWAERLINLDIDREAVKTSPTYDGATILDRSYESRLHAHYDNH